MLMSSNSSGSGSEAQLQYGPNGFRVLRAGQHVFCAVTGDTIPLANLRYWSVERQEPYSSAEVATERLKP